MKLIQCCIEYNFPKNNPVLTRFRMLPLPVELCAPELDSGTGIERPAVLPKVPGPTEVSSRAKCSLTFSVNAIFGKQANVSSKTQNYVGVCRCMCAMLSTNTGAHSAWFTSCVWLLAHTAHFHRAKVVNIFHFPWQFCTTFPAEGKLYPT